MKNFKAYKQFFNKGIGFFEEFQTIISYWTLFFICRKPLLFVSLHSDFLIQLDDEESEGSVCITRNVAVP
jgi:hypothetical protein